METHTPVKAAASKSVEHPPMLRGHQPVRCEASDQANPSIGAETSVPCSAVATTLTGEAGAPSLPNPDCVVTADASKVSPRNFLEALGLTSPEMREARRSQEIERCIRAIQRGDTYGFPPVFVAECRHIMAMRAEVRL